MVLVIIALCVIIIELIRVSVEDAYLNKLTSKGDNMDLVKLLNDLVSQINSLQTALADAQKAADELAAAKYAEGFEAGKLSVQSDKLYSQAELDAVVEPLKAQLMDLQTQVDAIPSKVSDAVSVAKAELLEKVKQAYDSAQASEAETEAAFKASLGTL